MLAPSPWFSNLRYLLPARFSHTLTLTLTDGHIVASLAWVRVPL